MNSKIPIMRNNKEGSYIVEASVILPIFIICVCAIILIIRIIAICENITFATSKELINASFGYFNNINKSSLCKRFEAEAKDASSIKINQLRYLYSDGEIEDLISVDATAKFKVNNVIGINSAISFREKIMCRAFSGSYRDGTPLGEDVFTSYGQAKTVYIFPKYGIRYHNKTCRYIKNKNEERSYIIGIDKEDAKRRGYTPCMVCQGAAYG